jgi:hypothetical protein
MDETTDETIGPRLPCGDRHANAAWRISGDSKITDFRTRIGCCDSGYSMITILFLFAASCPSSAHSIPVDASLSDRFD